MISRNYDVMVPDRFAEEIRIYCIGSIREHYGNLSPAEILSVFVVQDLCAAYKMMPAVRREFEYSRFPLRDFAVNADSDAGFEVCVEIVAACHAERQCAMCKENTARFRVHNRGIALEPAAAAYGARNGH